MKVLHLLLLCLIFGAMKKASAAPAASPKFALAIHGGAGVMRKDLPPAKEKACRAVLEQALLAGHAVLQTNGSSLDAVVAAIKILEDSPLFNAGRGSVLTSEGTVEMDASIMDGKNGRAGAVAGVKRIRNPIEAARAVMEKSPHVMMAGKGAEVFAKNERLKMAPPSYFITADRKAQLKRAQAAAKKQARASRSRDAIGTVGAVALDQAGNLAAGTSTGGMVNKRFGRVGDSPIIGAGTYADNRTCAVSGTGHGEYFIRAVAAHDVAALMEYKNLSLREASEEVVLKKLKTAGGSGGVIAVDASGNVSMPFNTEGMFRGQIGADGVPRAAVFLE